MTATSRLSLGVSLVAILAVTACGPMTPASSSSASSAPVEPSAAPTPNPGPLVGQTDTDWGRIWDGVPDVFPVYPGATPADDAVAEVVSATFALEAADPRTVAGWMHTELERAMYTTEALNGPLEDGSFVLDSAGSGSCRIQVSVAPLGGLTTVAVRYGAACPEP